MKRIITYASIILCAAALGCEKTPAEKQADLIRINSAQAAKDVKTDADTEAEAVRNQSEKTIVGTAKDPAVEERADEIEAAGKQRANEIKKAGEAEADRVEETAK